VSENYLKLVDFLNSLEHPTHTPTYSILVKGSSWQQQTAGKDLDKYRETRPDFQNSKTDG